MIKPIVKRFVLAYVAIKTFFDVIFDFIKWLFTNRATQLIIFLTFLSIIIWGTGFYYYLKEIDKTFEETNLTNPQIADRTDAIVVLTGGSERVRNALYLLDKGFADKLFISGVNIDVKPREIFALHRYDEANTTRLIDKVTLGYSANDTIENANEIARWVARNNIKSVRLITSNYHMKRALYEVSNKLPPDIKIIPHSVIPLNIRVDKWWQFDTSRNLLLDEYNKLAFSIIRINLEKIGIK